MYVANTSAPEVKDIDRILLVDDNPTNLQMLLQTLNGRGYKLLVAKNGENALRIAATAKPAIVLLDIMMSGMDGYEVCRLLKEDPETKNVTVIFLSALDDTKDKVKGLNVGAVDYISKPFQAEEVIARVETQLKIHRLERALSARNKQLEQDNERILESMNEGIFGLDKKGNITFANHAAAQMTGWSIDALTGVNLIALMLDTNNESVMGAEQLQPIRIALSENVTKTVENDIFWHSSGSAFPVSYSCTPILDENNVANGAVVVFRDITEKQKQKVALQQALDELEEQKDKLTHVSRLSIMGEMAAGFAHEVNQPLTAISNYAQVARRMLENLSIENEGLADTMVKINKQACRAGDIISRIRSFVKKPDHVLAHIDPNKLIKDTYKLAEVDARNNSMEIHLELTEGLPDVKVDPVQIQQVALNLIRNGMEAMRNESTRNIGVRVKTERLDINFVKVSVVDRGYGLAEGAEEKLFTPFYTTKSDGMGIGLSVCHSIIQSHGGKLDFQRHPDGGTVFEFTVPVAD